MFVFDAIVHSDKKNLDRRKIDVCVSFTLSAEMSIVVKLYV